MYRVRDGISADSIVDGSGLIRRHGRNSLGRYRAGRRRPQPSIRGFEPESVGARYDRADPARYEPAFQSVSVPFDAAKYGPMSDDPDRCSYHRGSADDVRSAVDRTSFEFGGDALPLTMSNGEVSSPLVLLVLRRI